MNKKLKTVTAIPVSLKEDYYMLKDKRWNGRAGGLIMI